MKKIFTFVVLATLALGVQAQEKFLLSPTATYTDGQVIEATAHTTLTVGMDGGLKTANFTAETANADFAQTYEKEGVETTQIVYLTGSNNPKDGDLDGGSSTGSSYSASKMNNPKSGMYVIINTKVAGELTVGVVVNGNKSFFVTKSDGSALDMSAITFTAPDGTEAAPGADNKFDSKFQGIIKFAAEAGESYYVFCTGSKIGYYGHILVSDNVEPQPGQLDIEPALPVTFDTWEANFLIKKTDVKAGDKFIFTCETIAVEGWEWGPQVLPKSNADWSGLGEAVSPGEDGKAVFEVTEEFAAIINENGGLRVQGMGVIVTAVEYVPAAGDDGVAVTTDPALPVTFNSWDANFLIPKTDVKAGDKFIFFCEPLAVEGWEWGPQVLPKSNADWSNLGEALVPGENGKAEFVITEDFAAVINGNGGLRVQGMGVIVTAVNYVGEAAPPPAEGDKVNLIDYFTGNWNGAETNTHNADGTVTYNGKQWGGLSAWFAIDDVPVDWSKYIKLVFEFAEPTPAACQGFVQGVNPADGKELNHTWWGNAGITKLECPFEGKDVTQIKQAALQAAAEATYQISAIYLVESADGIENMMVVRPLYDANAPVYNLAGIRVNKDYKGIVIQNGRKFIQK